MKNSFGHSTRQSRHCHASYAAPARWRRRVSLQSTPPPTSHGRERAVVLERRSGGLRRERLLPGGRRSRTSCATRWCGPARSATSPSTSGPRRKPGSVIYVPLAGGRDAALRAAPLRRSGRHRRQLARRRSRWPCPPRKRCRRRPAACSSPQPAPLPIPVGTAGFVPAPATSRRPSKPQRHRQSRPRLSAPAASVPTRHRSRHAPGFRPSSGPSASTPCSSSSRARAGSPPVQPSNSPPIRFTRIGEHRGFDVYQENGQPGTIYLSLLDGARGAACAVQDAG